MSETYDADVIVVGAGMLGAFAAERLARKGKAVLMLEAGPRVSRWRMVQGYRNAPDHSSFYPELAHAPRGNGGRYSDDYIETTGPIPWKPAVLRLVGGTTWHWSSAFWRYLPNDFKLRSLYGVGRDWPIGYDDLEPYYGQAEIATGCAGSDTDDQGAGKAGVAFPRRSTPYPLPAEPWSSYTQAMAERFAKAGYRLINEPQLRATRPYRGRPTCCGNNNCSPICPIGAMFTGDMAIAAAERAGVKLLENTVAWKLEKGAGGRIVAVHTKTPEGVSTRRTARVFIVAAHAMETAKLLLMSDIATASDQVGRNLLTHPSMVYQALLRQPVWPGRGPTQQAAGVEWRDGPFRATHSAFKYHINNNVPNLGITDRLLDEGVVGRALDERIRDESSRFVSLIAGMDMLPLASNRLSLGSGKDGLGHPTLRIHFDNDDYVRRAAVVVERDFARFDAAFGIEKRMGKPGAEPRPAGAHIMGSAIMGTDPRSSVVDGDCRTHDHANLFIASTAVFPTASTVNPTLTGAALSLRIADRIAGEA